ncbi:recombinase family protein [Nocardioides sp. NPDC006273]|uniref:recombinase family protein n=1 Tax=Nocardioides sp. NPDC006273 TaxID=3155598 RepID=UPI0033A48F3C
MKVEEGRTGHHLSNIEVTIYVRLSEDAQGNELGIERQEKECREYAAARGWIVREVIADNDLSATSGIIRPGFERLLDSDPEAILCWHLDRLLRISEDLERVIRLNINVFSKEAGWFDLSSPAGRAVARTVTAWNTYEGEQKAIRQKAQHRQRIENGGLTKTGRPWWPTRPLGFNMDGSLHEVEAPALKQIYYDILGGGSLNGAARYLNSLGVVTGRSGKPWTVTHLRPVLMHARNAGIYVKIERQKHTHRRGESDWGNRCPEDCKATYDQRRTEVGEAAWEPIVDEEVFRAVVRILSDPSRRMYPAGTRVGFGRRENLLTGFAKCSKCEGPMRAAWRHKNGKRHLKVYVCGGSCHGTTLPAEWADSMVLVQVIERVYMWEEMLQKAPAGGGEDIGALKARLKAHEENRAELIEDKALGLITREDLRIGLARIDREIVRLTDQINDAVTETDGMPWSFSDVIKWAHMDDSNEPDHIGKPDVEKMTPVLRRVCESIMLTGPGKGRKIGSEGAQPDDLVKIKWLVP